MAQLPAKAYLYQWTDMDEDFHVDGNLGRLGGNREAANKFRGIEDDIRESPSTPHWLIAARRDNDVWGTYALLKVRQSTAIEKSSHGVFDKYLYYDEAESGFLSLPGQGPLLNDRIDRAIKKKITGQTQGRNGTAIEITSDLIAELSHQIQLTVGKRKEQLRGTTTGQRDTVESPSPPLAPAADANVLTNLDESASPVPADAISGPTIPIDAQVALELDTQCLKTAEREAVVNVRYGQGAFRDALITAAGEKCWMSGIEGRRLLVASHIKPWSHCDIDPNSRGRTDNGLLLSALWDAAFDAGLISFDSRWNVIASSELSESAKHALGLKEPRALPMQFRTDGRKEYLDYHRTTVFESGKQNESLTRDMP